MLIVQTRSSAGHRVVQSYAAARILVGRDPSCDLVLDAPGVAARHAALVVDPRGPYVCALDPQAELRVNGQPARRHGPLTPADRVQLGGFELKLAVDRTATVAPTPAPAPAPAPATATATATAASARATTPEGTTPPGTAPRGAAPLDAAPQRLRPASAGAGGIGSGAPAELQLAWRRRVHEQLLATLDLRRVDTHRMSDAQLRAATEAAIAEVIAGLDGLPAAIDRARLAAEVRDEAIGLGPLEPLLADPEVTEIMVNRHDEVFVERGGRLQRSPHGFTSDRAVAGIIERIVAPIGRRIDEASPMVDARLKDGSRVNAVIPPLALKGPTLTIRKFPARRMTPEDLLRAGSASPAMLEFLRFAVAQRRNIVISGGTGSGKTTLLNVLAGFIPPHERVVTIEDAAELRLPQANLVTLEARPPNLEGRGQVGIRDLVRNALRMRPDRIVVGECRGGEALDMLQAMNTGHEGSLTTAHANSPRDLLGRLEVMVMMAGMDLPVAAIREQIAAAVDLVVQQTRAPCGRRRITHVCELTGIESGRIQMQELFRFVPAGQDASGASRGAFTGCGAVPEFYEALRAGGVSVDCSWFAPAAGSAAARGTA